jgi:hypothetical protein
MPLPRNDYMISQRDAEQYSRSYKLLRCLYILPARFGIAGWVIMRDNYCCGPIFKRPSKDLARVR